MKRYIPLLLILSLLLCGCAAKAPAETTAATIETTAAPTTEPTEAPTTQEATEAPTTQAVTEPTEAPTEPVVLFRHPLTGAPMDSVATARPIAITINNIEYAMPMCGLNQSDMVFEILAEGGVTRCLAMFTDISGLDHIGSIRSTRPYLVDLAEGYDAIYIHHGGSKDGYEEIYNMGTDNLDALTKSAWAYYRDEDRLNQGYAYEHTSFADGDDLLDAAREWEYALVREEGVDFGLQFDKFGSTQTGTDAAKLTVVFGGFGKTTELTYNTDTGFYSAAQHGTEIIDGNTYEDVTYRNVIYITAETYSYVDDNAVERLDITLTGEGEGYFACDGKVVPIRWSREHKEAPFVYTMEDGTPITLGVGRSYVAVAPLSGELIFN